MVFKERACAARVRILAVIPAKAGIHFRLCLWPFARTLSLPTEEDTDAAIYIRLIRSGFGRGVPSREPESNAKTKAKIIKWIPAFAGMTVVFPHRGAFSTAPRCSGGSRTAPTVGSTPMKVVLTGYIRRIAKSGLSQQPLAAGFRSPALRRESVPRCPATLPRA